MNLVPMLLIEKKFSVADSALAMALIKAMSVLGTFVSGHASFRFGMKGAILLSFFVGGVALLPLPYAEGFISIVFFAGVAQFAQSLFTGPVRLLVREMVPPAERQMSWGHFRTAINLGQIVSYSVGTFISGLSLPLFFLINSVTSIIASFVGVKIIPTHTALPEAETEDNGSISGKHLVAFFSWALVMGGFSLLYEIFITSTAAFCKLDFGTEGPLLFSKIMLINTAICTVLAIPAAKRIKNPTRAVPIGILGITLGAMVIFLFHHSPLYTFFGVFLVTAGEVTFTALATYILMQLTPRSKKQHYLFGHAMVLQPIGRIIGGALSFPFVIYGDFPALFTFGLGAILLLFFLWQKDNILKHLPAN